MMNATDRGRAIKLIRQAIRVVEGPESHLRSASEAVERLEQAISCMEAVSIPRLLLADAVERMADEDADEGTAREAMESAREVIHILQL